MDILNIEDECDNLPAMLRKLADAIESGESPWTALAIVAEGDEEIGVYGAGRGAADAMRAVGLLHTGAHQLSDALRSE